MIQKILSYRYWLGLMVVILGVALNLHGSSIANWNNYGLSQTIGGEQMLTQNHFKDEAGKSALLPTILNWVTWPPRPDGTIMGTPKMIRSDEWLVQTPFYLSQAYSGFQLDNQAYATSGQNMMVAYHAPIKHPAILGKPFNWGFLFLGAERGLSFYWVTKLVALMLLAYEFSMILTRRKPGLSLVSAIWVTFTPAVQWWFMQHLGDVLVFSLLIMVAFYHFFRVKQVWKQMGLAALIGSGLIGFVLVIYPAFQVPFAYLMLLFCGYWLWQTCQSRRLLVREYVLISVTVLLAGSIIGLTLWESKEALVATLNTVYPGKRVSFGGETTLYDGLMFLLGPVLPFIIPAFKNQVELATSFNILPLAGLGILPFFNFKNCKKNLLGYLFLAYAVFLTVYSIIGIPVGLSKLILFSYVPSGRAWQTLAVLAVFVSIWFVSYLWDQDDEGLIKKIIVLLGANLPFVILAMIPTAYSSYIGIRGLWWLLGLQLFFSIVVYFRQRYLTYLLVIVLSLISGATVNPMVQGLGVIEDKALVQAIRHQITKNPKALWLTDNNGLYQIPSMLGAYSVGGVRFYPDKNLMTQLDPKGHYQEQWNRYAHVRYKLESGSYLEMVNPAPDSLSITLGEDYLAKLGVSYILTDRDLEELFGQEFLLIYGPDKDGNRLYRYNPF